MTASLAASAQAILVLNAGSSSVKFALFPAHAYPAGRARLCEGQCSGIGHAAQFDALDGTGSTLVSRNLDQGTTHEDAMAQLLQWLAQAYPAVELLAAGHRVVHGGDIYSAPVRIDQTVQQQLRALIPLAPLHQPHALAAIEAVRNLHPDLAQVACFDTAFHNTLPPLARAFALPQSITTAGVRRYGFHGLSYEYIASCLGDVVGVDVAAGRVVVAHLGSGASLCAMQGGRSVATTMSFTPLDGLVMGRRCGSLDPGVLLYLMQQQHMSVDAVADLLYGQSGLLGVSGISDDMRDLLASKAPEAAEAVALFVYRLGLELGSMVAALGGIDALVFTAGIGEHAQAIRERVCDNARWLGFDLDPGANAAGQGLITRTGVTPSAWVIPTDEDLMIARHVWSNLAQG